MKSPDLELIHKEKPLPFTVKALVPQINHLLDGGFQSGNLYYYATSKSAKQLINLVHPLLDAHREFSILILKDQNIKKFNEVLDELIVQQDTHPKAYIIYAPNLTDNTREQLAGHYQFQVQLLFNKLKILTSHKHILVITSSSHKLNQESPHYTNMLGSLYADIFLFSQESPQFSRYWLLKHPEKPVRCVIKKIAQPLIRHSPTSKCSCSRPLQNIALIPFHSQLVDSVPPNR